MLLPTITYIPTILAYIFISLLIFILGFIVLYISHKIYGYIYDNLPLVNLTTEEMVENRNSLTNQINSNAEKRKSKPALRVYVHLEPCNLAYYLMDSKTLQQAGITPLDQSTKLIKYFDSLSAIPPTDDMDECLANHLLQKKNCKESTF